MLPLKQVECALTFIVKIIFLALHRVTSAYQPAHYFAGGLWVGCLLRTFWRVEDHAMPKHASDNTHS